MKFIRFLGEFCNFMLQLAAKGCIIREQQLDCVLQIVS